MNDEQAQLLSKVEKVTDNKEWRGRIGGEGGRNEREGEHDDDAIFFLTGWVGFQDSLVGLVKSGLPKQRKFRSSYRVEDLA